MIILIAGDTHTGKISGTRLIVKFVLANPLTAFTSGYLNKLYCTS